MKTDEIRILVAAHKEAYVPKHPYLRAIQVGTAAAKQKLPGMLYDNEGENISEKNASYCELTAQYWAWKNLKADYYGFFHYRRYMNFAKEYPVGKNRGRILWRQPPYEEIGSIRGRLADYGLEAADIQKIVKKYDVAAVLGEHMNVTVYRQFCQFHDKKELDCAIRIVKRRHPAYAQACDKYMNSKYVYFCNMYLMRRDLFYQYMEWLFPVLEEFETARRRFGGAGGERMAGYIAERLFGVYYTQLKMQGRARCCEFPYLMIQDPACGGRLRRFSLFGLHLSVDMRNVNRLLPAGSLRRRIVRAVMGRYL